MAGVGPLGHLVPPRQARLAVVLSLLIAVLAVGEGIPPIRKAVAVRYIARGDAYMVSQDFDSASAQYKEAVDYDRQNKLAQQRLELAQAADTDIAATRGFFQEKNIQSVLTRLDQAQKPYTAPKEALAAGVQFYQNQEYSYAQYPLERAVQLDPAYAEAWHYLALDYAKLTALNPSYKTKEDEATKRQNLLTPMYLVGSR